MSADEIGPTTGTRGPLRPLGREAR